MPLNMPCQDATEQSRFRLSASQLVFLLLLLLIEQNSKSSKQKRAINIRLGARVKQQHKVRGKRVVYMYKEWTGW